MQVLHRLINESSVRADASVKIGSGHIMRCLTLAESLRRNTASVTFISRKHFGNLTHLIKKMGFKLLNCISLNQKKLINAKTYKMEMSTGNGWVSVK